ncbi:MAG TPA: hypothetical protein VN207_13190 [Ktedonobacteraceae bacterium]|nr:hypothetical protein [Ktedonobacteraceae bacterium]
MKVKKQKDKKRHYLPAAAIGYFSADTLLEPLRKRLVWVLRKKSDAPRLDKAENVGFSKQIYGYGKGDLFDVDGYFKAAEPWIHQPVDSIIASIDSWTPADDWAKLAWYITIQITRNPDLELGAKDLIEGIGWKPNMWGVGSLLNAQRTSAAVIRARWEFVRSPDRDFILGDRGITGIYVSRWTTNGYFVPLRKNFGVMLGPAPYKKIVKWSDGSWRIDIPTYTALADVTDQINYGTWHAARQEIYGPNKEQLLEIKVLADSVPPWIQALAPRYEAAQLLGLDLQQRMNDEMLWLKLLFGMEKPEDTSEILYLTV